MTEVRREKGILFSREVFIVFVTNFTQYAIKGYEVRAFDYIVKPVQYGNFSLLMDKFLHVFCEIRTKTVTVVNGRGMIRLSLAEIYYIESRLHNLIFHTKKGDFTKRGRLSDMEKELNDFGFSSCGKSS